MLDSDGKMFCVVEDSVFVPPRSYVVLGKKYIYIYNILVRFIIYVCFIIFLYVQGAEQRRQNGIDNDEELLQFAVQQSLLETGAEEDQVIYNCIY